MYPRYIVFQILYLCQQMDVLSDSRDFEAIVSLFDNKGCAFTRGHCMTNEPVSEMMLLEQGLRNRRR